MMNFISNSITNFTNSALDITNYALGREHDNEKVSKSAGILVGSATGLAAATVFGVMAGVGTIATASSVPPIVPAIGAIGLALTPALASVAGKVTEVGTEILLEQITKK